MFSVQATNYYVDATNGNDNNNGTSPTTPPQIQNLYSRELNSFVVNPDFVNAASKDYHLSSSSPCIDAGGFLTKTSSAGSGTQIPVDNIIYFFDGFGMVGGDTIQLQGQTQKRIITNIDTATNTLTVNQSISWNLGDGVALSFSGTAPDIGAYEYSNSIGISENTKNNIHIYPNPFCDKIILPTEVIDFNYELISLTGEIIKRSKIVKNELDLSKLSSGVYFIRIINASGKVYSKNLIKM